MPKHVGVIAHRGLNRRAPENTMAAFRAAVDARVDWIETDVDILGDGTPIICHDSTLDRTTNRRGSYAQLSRADLTTIDAGSWFSTQYTGEPMPTLSQLVDYMNATGLNANIEVKANERGKAATIQLVEAVVAELARLEPGPRVIISSFSQLILRYFLELAPTIPRACLFETCALYDDWRSVLEILECSYIHPEDAGLTEAHVERFLHAGYGVNVWTVNEADRVNQLFHWGVTGVFSDIADLLPRRAIG